MSRASVKTGVFFTFDRGNSTTEDSNDVETTSDNEDVDDTSSSKSDIPKAEVVNADGETEEFTMSELAALAEENDLKFEDKYQTQQITVVGIVESVQEYSEEKNVMGSDGQIRTQGYETYVQLKLEEGWEINLYESENQDACADLSAGDKVSVESQIWDEFGGIVTLSDSNDYPTEITVLDE